MRRACLSVLLVFAMLPACGKSSNNKDAAEDQDPKPSSNQENIFDEFDNKLPTQVANLISAFGIEQGSLGMIVAFYSEQRYFSGSVQQLAARHYRIAASVGHYHEQGNEIKPKANRATCPSAVGGVQVNGKVNGNNLILTKGSASVVLARLNIPSGNTSSGLVIEWGCFAPGTLAFTPHEWVEL